MLPGKVIFRRRPKEILSPETGGRILWVFGAWYIKQGEKINKAKVGRQIGQRAEFFIANKNARRLKAGDKV